MHKIFDKCFQTDTIELNDHIHTGEVSLIVNDKIVSREIKVMDCRIVISVFVLHFRANTLGNLGMNPTILIAMG